jgi:hypothetical protein
LLLCGDILTAVDVEVVQILPCFCAKIFEP